MRHRGKEVGVSGVEIQPILLSVDETAVFLGLSSNTIRKMANQGDLPKVKIGSRTLFDRDDLRAFVEKLKGKKR